MAHLDRSRAIYTPLVQRLDWQSAGVVAVRFFALTMRFCCRDWGASSKSHGSGSAAFRIVSYMMVSGTVLIIGVVVNEPERRGRSKAIVEGCLASLLSLGIRACLGQVPWL